VDYDHLVAVFCVESIKMPLDIIVIVLSAVAATAAVTAAIYGIRAYRRNFFPKPYVEPVGSGLINTDERWYLKLEKILVGNDGRRLIRIEKAILAAKDLQTGRTLSGGEEAAFLPTGPEYRAIKEIEPGSVYAWVPVNNFAIEGWPSRKYLVEVQLVYTVSAKQRRVQSKLVIDVSDQLQTYERILK